LDGIEATDPDYGNLVSYWKMNDGIGQIVTDSKAVLMEPWAATPAWGLTTRYGQRPRHPTRPNEGIYATVCEVIRLE